MFAIIHEAKVSNMEQPSPIATGKTEDQEAVVADRLDFRGGPTVSVAVLLPLVQSLQTLEPGQAVELKTDAFEGLHADVMAWGRLAGHQVQHVQPPNSNQEEQATTTTPEYSQYIIVKGTSQQQQEEHQHQHHVAIIISKPGLDELLGPLGFAVAAACAGWKVSLYFLGPGVRVLRRNFRGQLPGLWAPFSGWARRGMDRMGHAPPAAKLDALQLPPFGAALYACHPSLRVFGVKERDLRDGVILAEYATFLEVVKDADQVLYP